MTEAWRVADRTLTSPAHLIVWQQAGVIDRAEMFGHRFGCTKCMTVAKSLTRSAT